MTSDQAPVYVQNCLGNYYIILIMQLIYNFLSVNIYRRVFVNFCEYSKNYIIIQSSHRNLFGRQTLTIIP